jgi:hypothetical protein
MYRLEVKKPLDLLRLLVEEFSSPDVLLNLSGDVSQFDRHLFGDDVEVKDWPQSGRDRHITIPLSAKNVSAVIESVLPRIGVRSRIYQITIERGGETLFSAFDNFSGKVWGLSSEKGAGISSSVSQELLERLAQLGVIRSYALGGRD